MRPTKYSITTSGCAIARRRPAHRRAQLPLVATTRTGEAAFGAATVSASSPSTVCGPTSNTVGQRPLANQRRAVATSTAPAPDIAQSHWTLRIPANTKHQKANTSEDIVLLYIQRPKRMPRVTRRRSALPPLALERQKVAFGRRRRRCWARRRGRAGRHAGNWLHGVDRVTRRCAQTTSFFYI